MIYTTYFANVKNLPSNIIPISIAGKAPDEWSGLQYRKLAPKWSFFSVWKETHDNEYYIKCFNEQVLSQLNPQKTAYELLITTSGAKPHICLVCYERPEEFCHRHLVADWLNANGIECKEFIKEQLG